MISSICFLRHIDTKGEEHIDIHEMFMIGFQADAQNGLFAAFTNVWMLLNYFRVINSEWPLQIMGDGTFKFCDQDIGLLGKIQRFVRRFLQISTLWTTASTVCSTVTEHFNAGIM